MQEDAVLRSVEQAFPFSGPPPYCRTVTPRSAMRCLAWATVYSP